MAKEPEDIDAALARRQKALESMAEETKAVQEAAQDVPQSGYINFGPDNINQLPGANLASFYINRFHGLMDDDLTRISFGQSVVGEKPGNWHFSITLKTSDALSLARQILELHAARQRDRGDGEK